MLDEEPIRIGIGIAAGAVMAGYTDTEARATSIGATVNLAARLEVSRTLQIGRAVNLQ